MLGLNHYKDNSHASWWPLKAREMRKSLSYGENKLSAQNLDQKVVKIVFFWRLCLNSNAVYPTLRTLKFQALKQHKVDHF